MATVETVDAQIEMLERKYVAATQHAKRARKNQKKLGRTIAKKRMSRLVGRSGIVRCSQRGPQSVIAGEQFTILDANICSAVVLFTNGDMRPLPWERLIIHPR